MKNDPVPSVYARSFMNFYNIISDWRSSFFMLIHKLYPLIKLVLYRLTVFVFIFSLFVRALSPRFVYIHFSQLYALYTHKHTHTHIPNIYTYKIVFIVNFSTFLPSNYHNSTLLKCRKLKTVFHYFPKKKSCFIRNVLIEGEGKLYFIMQNNYLCLVYATLFIVHIFTHTRRCIIIYIYSASRYMFVYYHFSLLPSQFISS